MLKYRQQVTEVQIETELLAKTKEVGTHAADCQSMYHLVQKGVHGLQLNGSHRSQSTKLLTPCLKILVNNGQEKGTFPHDNDNMWPLQSS